MANGAGASSTGGANTSLAELHIMRQSHILIACVLSFVSTGCVVYQSGGKLDPATVNQIQRDVTTRAQVETLLGRAMKVDMIDVGQRILHYWYREIDEPAPSFSKNTPDTITRHQMLLMWIGTDSKVRDFEFSDYLTSRGEVNGTIIVKRAPTPPLGKPPSVRYSGGEE